MSHSDGKSDKVSLLNSVKNKVFRTKPTEKIESQIDSAQKRGEFENLRGSGEPLRLDTNPFTKESAIATELLKNSGFSLPFIQEKNEIETAVSKAEKKLLIVWQRYDGTPKSRQKWQAAKEQFAEEIKKINKRILTYNLKAPSVQLHISAIRIEEQIRAVQESIM
ncbi:MAG: DUF1992 domain-containing protein [Chloroflexota bacterium]